MRIINTVFLIAFLFPAWAQALEVRLETQKASFHKGELITVDVFLDATDPVNVISAKLIYPERHLSLGGIVDGSSAVSLWIDRPKRTSSGEISFSGMTPGGIEGKENKVFSATFVADRPGDVAFGLIQGEAFLHDGLGSAHPFETSLSISIDAGESLSPEEGTFLDTIPPEDFFVTLSHDPNLFGGKYFLVFTTQDKESGIDHYKVREGRWGFFRTAESPYLLRDQSPTHSISVKAVDRFGNERVAVFHPEQTSSLWDDIKGLVVVVLLVSITGIILWRRYTK